MSDSAILDYTNSPTRPGETAIVSVASASVLTAMDEPQRCYLTGMHFWASVEERLYVLERASTATPDGVNVIAASVGNYLLVGGAGNNTLDDYVIVGAGTAGATLAKFLSDAVAGKFVTSVRVLEAGQNLQSDPLVQIGAPLGYTPGSRDPKYSDVLPFEWGTQGGPGHQINPGFAVYGYSEGRQWGGSSGHNYLQTVRGTPDIYNGWGAGWTYNDLLPLMKSLETYTPQGTAANPAQRGAAGPLFDTQDAVAFASALYTGPTAAFEVAANAPVQADYNDPATVPHDIGTGATQWFVTPPANPTPNKRSFSASAFLNALVVDQTTGAGVGGRLLNVVSNARVTKVLFSGTQAVGVEYFFSDSPDVIRRAFARREVVLAAGVMNDPAILQRSGVGDPALLGPLGIPVVASNTNVGAHLQCHIGFAALIANDPGALIPPLFPAGKLISVYQDLSGDGTHSTGAHNVSDGIRRAQLLVIPGIPAIPSATFTAIDPQPVPADIVSIVFANVRPSSRGTVKIVSADPLKQPKINFNFYDPAAVDSAGATDLDNAVAAAKVIANVSIKYGTLFVAPVANMMPIWPPAAHYPAAEYAAGGGAAPSDARLQEDILLTATDGLFNHGVGTCAMGANPATSVVDLNLRVHGVTGLSVCSDAIMPQITTGNTAYPAYVIGMKKATIEGVVIP